MSSLAPSRRSLCTLTACLVAAFTEGCADSGASGDDSVGTETSTTSTTGAASSTGGPTVSGSVTASTSATAASSLTSGSVTGSNATTSGSVGGTGTSTSSGGATSTTSASATEGTSSTDGAMTGTGGATGTVTGTDTGTSTGAGGSGGGTPNDCPVVPALMGGQEYCQKEVKGSVGNGYGYELWSEQMGTGCMRVYGQEATFGAEWSNQEDFLARVGLDFNQTQTHEQIGNLVADFAHMLTEEGGGLTYVGIYGWTVDPLVEYYILDDWGVTKPAGTASDGTPRTHHGTITADGANYEVWSKFREDKPAITGDSEDFYQYFSIRETSRKCGRISISEHFRQWEELGIDLGKLHEAKWLAEAQNNSGSIEFTTATVVIE